MDLEFSAEEVVFRDEVRAFVKEHLPQDIRTKVLEGRYLVKDDYVRWHKILSKKGWYTPVWPKAYGGCEWTPIQRHIFDYESCQLGAPPVYPFGPTMLGPTIIAYGTEELKQRFLPPILNCEIWFCQGFSEPNAGSDLASLRTSAVRDGDHYIINGQKTWTSLAHQADYMFALVRTDNQSPRKQDGISMLLIDMKSPGISIRPIRTLDGGCDVNETFFDNVRVPVANLVGQENRGWSCAKYLLKFERSSIARIGVARTVLSRLKRIAAAQSADGKPLTQDRRFRDRLAMLEIEFMGLEMTNLRFLAMQNGGKEPGVESSILKLKGSEVHQALSELLVEAMGPYALPFRYDVLEAVEDLDPVGPDYAAHAFPTYLNLRKLTIFGGASEIQRNIYAKAALGL
ncbi:MAG: acyl-CoA dehydrogenase family protein [Polaromonas sp.]|uniref:acyl-CoA dehydrogenase family protein n=1 Tax=Polaromonas sp. TaxID=1869339 RepID=UPI0025E2EE4F|nr:acyl-CoA dehydrogenase family protein [Polaromonas sp.]MBI2727742.1 acyl-CoA dehydrogenase family protein [Polaromonas sp.]